MTRAPRTTRHFYLYGGVAAAIIALVGFARTFYLKTLFDTPPLTPLVHLHGLVMTTWVALFVVQTWLVAAHRTQVHRRLGLFGAGWALLVLVVGTTTGIEGARLGHSPGPPPLKFLVVPLGDMVVFATLVGIGLYLRNRREVHRRLMLLATLGILMAAFGRLPLAFIQSHRPLVPFLLVDLVVLAFIAFDTFKHRRLHPAFGWGGGLILASFPLRILLAQTEAWLQFAGWLVHARS